MFGVQSKMIYCPTYSFNEIDSLSKNTFLLTNKKRLLDELQKAVQNCPLKFFECFFNTDFTFEKTEASERIQRKRMFMFVKEFERWGGEKKEKRERKREKERGGERGD